MRRALVEKDGHFSPLQPLLDLSKVENQRWQKEGCSSRNDANGGHREIRQSFQDRGSSSPQSIGGKECRGHEDGHAERRVLEILGVHEGGWELGPYLKWASHLLQIIQFNMCALCIYG